MVETSQLLDAICLHILDYCDAATQANLICCKTISAFIWQHSGILIYGTFAKWFAFYPFNKDKLTSGLTRACKKAKWPIIEYMLLLYDKRFKLKANTAYEIIKYRNILTNVYTRCFNIIVHRGNVPTIESYLKTVNSHYVRLTKFEFNNIMSHTSEYSKSILHIIYRYKLFAANSEEYIYPFKRMLIEFTTMVYAIPAIQEMQYEL
jgi:hypothetical protein